MTSTEFYTDDERYRVKQVTRLSDGGVCVIAVELDHHYPPHLAWRERVTITIRPDHTYRFVSWNMGIDLGKRWHQGIDAAITAWELQHASTQNPLDHSGQTGTQG